MDEQTATGGGMRDQDAGAEPAQDAAPSTDAGALPDRPFDGVGEPWTEPAPRARCAEGDVGDGELSGLDGDVRFDAQGEGVPGLTRIHVDKRELWVATTPGALYVLRFPPGSPIDQILAQ